MSILSAIGASAPWWPPAAHSTFVVAAVGGIAHNFLEHFTAARQFPMSIRRATMDDAASLAAISIEVWIGTYLRRGVNAFFASYALSEFTETKFIEHLADENQVFFVSDNEEGIDGFIRISTGRPPPVMGCSTTEISMLYVQPRHHGNGLGKRLLTRGLDHCRSIGAKSVWLAANAENSSAIRFYLTQGFEIVGQTHFRLENEAYLNEVFAFSLISE